MTWPYRAVSLFIAFLVFFGVQVPGQWRKVAVLLPATILLVVTLAWYFWPGPRTVITLTRSYDEASQDNCYDGIRQANASITLRGEKEDRLFVACEYPPIGSSEEPSSTSRTYSFKLDGKYQGQQILAFEGLFGVDEEDDGRDLGHDDAEATWIVSQGDQKLCTVTASWKSPGRCVMDEAFALLPGEPLEIRETLVERGANPQKHVWLGVARPQLVVRS